MKKAIIRRVLTVSVSAVLLLTSGCGLPSYEGFSLPPEKPSTLSADSSYYVERNFDSVAPTVQTTIRTFTSEDGLCVIEQKPSYYEVTLDYDKGSPYEVGAAYGRTILQMAPGYPVLVEGYLLELIHGLMGEQDTYDELMARISSLKGALDTDYQQELEGFAAAISNGEHTITADGKLSYEEAVLLSMVPDALRATACSAMTVNGNRTASGHRIAARVLEWDLGSEGQLNSAHCVTHFCRSGQSFTTVGLLGMFSILTAVNEYGVMTGELDVGSTAGKPFVCTGKTCYTYDLRHIMEYCHSAKDAADYLCKRSGYYAYSFNALVVDDRDALCVELPADEEEGSPVVRDSHTELVDGLTWRDPDCLCIINSFVAKTHPEQMLTVPSNLIRWKKYEELFCSSSEKLSLNRFKALMTAEKVKDSPVYNFRSELMVHMAVVDFDTHRVQVLFSGKEDPDAIEWIDLGAWYDTNGSGTR